MSREFYLDLAASGTRFPIGADLVLKKYSEHEKSLNDGKRLANIIAEAAAKFKTSLAMPVMDLMLEKTIMLQAVGQVRESDVPKWYFSDCPTAEQIVSIHENIKKRLGVRLQANVDAISYIVEHTELVPIGMSIGPFSLMTKLLAETITTIYLAAMGESREKKIVETLMELSVLVISHSFKAQAKAGAKAFFIAEPAANIVFVSPKQMAEDSNVFENMVLKYLRSLKEMMDDAGVDLLFHCCADLAEEMIKGYVSLKPVLLSLGSSRKLWEDADIVPKDIVLYGNLPSKKFYDDDLINAADVRRMAIELIARMKAAKHPFILGTECDVLSVCGCEKKIMSKVMSIVNCSESKLQAIA
jgi:uroporphyrinogen-III decarboxylase